MRALVDTARETLEEIASDTAATPAPVRRRPRRRAWIVATAALVALTVGVGAYAFEMWRSRGPDEASVSEAVTRFRSSSTTVASEAMRVRPAAGVYTYAGSGEEELSFAGTHQTEGPSIPGTVTYGDNGCWTFQVEYNTFHRQTWNWCTRGGRVVETRRDDTAEVRLRRVQGRRAEHDHV